MSDATWFAGNRAPADGSFGEAVMPTFTSPDPRDHTRGFLPSSAPMQATEIAPAPVGLLAAEGQVRADQFDRPPLDGDHQSPQAANPAVPRPLIPTGRAIVAEVALRPVSTGSGPDMRAGTDTRRGMSDLSDTVSKLLGLGGAQ